MTNNQLPAGCVVVGVDGSEHAQRAVTWAARQAALEGRRLAVVHSTEPTPARDAAWLDVQGIDYGELAHALAEAEAQTVEAACAHARQVVPGVEVLPRILHEDPRQALVDLSGDAHLLVVGSRGRGPLRSAVLGSVSASVARHAHCPVVVCRPSRGETAGVVVGADGSPGSRPVLEFAFEQASLRGLPLTVMHCFWDVLTATTGSGPADDSDLEDLRLLLAESTSGLQEKYPDVVVTRQLTRGLVDQCLADAAPAAELLVVGRSTPVGFDRFLHTSCALAVLERAHTTVAVVPETTEPR